MCKYICRASAAVLVSGSVECVVIIRYISIAPYIQRACTLSKNIFILLYNISLRETNIIASCIDG